MKPIIESLLDTDMYKLTMMQVFLHQMPTATGEYTFKCRNATGKHLERLVPEIQAQIEMLGTLRFTSEDLDYLETLGVFKPQFLAFLKIFQLDPESVVVQALDGDLSITVNGPLYLRSYFEIFILAIVNELYFQELDTPEVRQTAREKLQNKIELLKTLKPAKNEPLIIADFGTRRRFSREWQEEVVKTLLLEVPQYLKGTSNLKLAKDLGITPVGTMAHEYLQAHQALGSPLREFQVKALETWVKEYEGKLGIALTDVIGMDAFLRDFNPSLTKTFDGLRHDSGDPIEWGEKAILHYKNNGIDPTTKMLVFSDGLSVPKAIEIYNHFKAKTKVSFGIGTDLTNDVGFTPLNIVMKLTQCNGQPVAKISDSSGKGMCHDEIFLSYLKKTFSIAE